MSNYSYLLSIHSWRRCKALSQ